MSLGNLSKGGKSCTISLRQTTSLENIIGGASERHNNIEPNVKINSIKRPPYYTLNSNEFERQVSVHLFGFPYFHFLLTHFSILKKYRIQFSK